MMVTKKRASKGKSLWTDVTERMFCFFFHQMEALEHLLLPASGGLTKVPRAPNAYILLAREWREKLAREHPGEGCTQISVR
jgi:hypothetical protein